MAQRNMHCGCGSTHCICQDGCICSPPDCRCLICAYLKAKYFDKCAGELLTPLDNFPVTGRIRRDLDKLHEEIPQCYKKCNAASNYPQKYETDDDLIFQMDDIDDPPERPEHELASSNVRGHSGSLQPSSDITISNPRQSETRKEPRIYDCGCAQQCRGPRMLRDLELQTETSLGTPCIFGAEAFRSNESRVTEAPTTQINLANSELNPTVIILTPEDSKVTEAPITDDPRSSELNPGINISIPEDSKPTETPITQDCPKSSESNSGKILNPGKLLTSDVSGEELSSSNMYSSETLPSDLSSGDDDDSQSSHSSAAKSPIKIISTSAPALFDVPEPFRELESPPKQDASDVLNSPGESTTNLPRIETLLISDSQSTDKNIPLELGLSIETISTDVEANVDDLPPLYFMVSPSVLTATTEVESSEPKTAAIPYPEEKFLKIPSPEFSQNDSKKETSSESSSSIETLPTEPSNEQFTDEPHKSTSPKKDN